MVRRDRPLILHVDDNDAGRYAVSRALLKAGYEVIETNNGSDALQLSREKEPDLVLLDVNLPDINGFEVCKRIKSDPRTAMIPVVHLSAEKVRSQDHVHGIDAGADGYLIQPIDPGVLVATVKAFLRLRAADEALRASEDRYRDLVEHSHDLICTHDLDGTLLSVNATAERYTGYSAEELCGRNLADLLVGDAKAGLAGYLEEVRSKGVAQGEMLIRTASGDERWWRYDNSLRTDGVAVPQVRGVAQDITEQKRADALLQETEARFRAAFELAAVGIAQVATDGRWLRVNRKLCEILGYDAEELLTLRFQDVTHPDDLGADLKQVAALLAGEASEYAMEKRYIRKDGRVAWVLLHVALVRDAHGGPEYFISAVDDVTERRRVAQELVDFEERFRGLVEQSIAGIYIIQEGRFVYANERMAEILGHGSSRKVIGTDPLQTVAPRDRERVASSLKDRFSGRQELLDYEFAIVRPDHSEVEVQVHSTRVTYQGKPAVIGLLQDVSEVKRSRDEILRYVAQLKEAVMETVKVATRLGELRDPYTAGHVRRVAEIAVAIGAELGLAEIQLEGLRVAGYLHDIGKITIPAEILSKPGKLNPLEFRLIQGHPQAAYDVLAEVQFPWPVALAALQHHERIDGSGYPQGLKGEEIILEARILTVADVVEAMSSHRPYRPGSGIELALAEIERGRGTAYDAAVADACLKLFREQGYAIPE